MKQFNTQISDEESKLLEEISKKYGVSKSDIGRLALKKFFESNVIKVDEIPTDDDYLNDQLIHLKMNGNLYNTLKLIAENNGVSLSAELRFRIISTIAKRSILTDKELSDIRKNSFEISRLATNINYIAKAVNSGAMISADDDLKLLISSLIKLLEKNKNYLEKIKKSSSNRYKYQVS